VKQVWNVIPFTAPGTEREEHTALWATASLLEDTMSQTDTLERTAIIVYALLQELHHVLADPRNPDEVTLGIVMGNAIFCDEKIGPFRARKLMQEAPDIVLRTDAHVTDDTAALFAPVLRAFSKHLLEMLPQQKSPVGEPEVTAA
jgi:hypothetical protein